MCREEKGLIEAYEQYCPNGDMYGLRGDRIKDFNLGAVNDALKRVSVGLIRFPDHFRRIWLGHEEEERLSLLDLAFKELTLDCLSP